MTDIKNGQKNDGINPIVAAMAGAVVGGIAAIGAMVMSDKNNQEKAEELVSTVKNEVEDKKSEVVKKAKKLESIAKNAVKEVKKQLES